MDIYIVTAAAAVVKPVGAAETYRYLGDMVPADAENLEHLLSTGLVGKAADGGAVEVADKVADKVAAEPPALDDMTLDELRAYAKDREINLEGATRKDEVLEKIRAAQA